MKFARQKSKLFIANVNDTELNGLIQRKNSFTLVQYGAILSKSLENCLNMSKFSVANAKFSLLKLLIYEPYYLCLSRLECQT